MAISLQKSQGMTSPRSLRSPLLSLLGAGVVLVACSSDDSGGLSGPYQRYNGPNSSGSPSSSGSSGSGSKSAGPSSSSGNGASASSGSGSTGSTGSTGTGNTGGNTEVDAAPPPPATPAFTVAVDDAAPSMNLADTKVLNITVTPQAWSGPVTLSVASLPSDVTGAFDNATLSVEGTAPLTAKLTLTSISSSAPVATPFTIVGTAGSTVKSTPATLTVKSYLTIHLPVNADSMSGGFGDVTITAPADIANNPVTINFVNDDSTPHEIHAENPDQGFAHGQGTFAQGQADAPVRMVTVAGTYAWHLHDDAPSAGPADSHVIIQ
jgi:hypothetical protein